MPLPIPGAGSNVPDPAGAPLPVVTSTLELVRLALAGATATPERATVQPGNPFTPQLQLPPAMLATTASGPAAFPIGAMAKVRWQAYPAGADGKPDSTKPMPERDALMAGPAGTLTPTFLFRPRVAPDGKPAEPTAAYVVAHLEVLVDGTLVRRDVAIPVDVKAMATREVYEQLGRLFKVQVSSPAIPAGGILRASVLPRGAEETEFVVKTASLQGKPILEVTGSLGLDGAMTALNAIAGRAAAPGAFALHDVATSIALLNDPADRVAATLAMLGEPVDRLAKVLALLSEPADRVAATIAMLSEPVDRVASALALASLPVDKVADVAAVLLIPLDRIAGIVGLLSEPLEQVAKALHLLGYPAEKVAQALAMLVEPVAGAINVVSAFIGHGTSLDVDAGALTRQAGAVTGGAGRLGDAAGTVAGLLDTSDLRRRIASILAASDVKGQVQTLMQAPGFQERMRLALDDRGLPERLAAVLDASGSARRLRPLQQTGRGRGQVADVLAGRGRLERVQAQAARDGVARGVQLPINVQVRNADFTKHLVRREDDDPLHRLTPRPRQLPEVPGLVDEMQVADRLPDNAAFLELGPLRLPFAIKDATWAFVQGDGEGTALPAERYRFVEGTAARRLIRSIQLGVPAADTALRLVVRLQFGFDAKQLAAEGLEPLQDGWVALPAIPVQWLGLDVLGLVAEQVTLAAPATVPAGGRIPASLACPLFAPADPAAKEVQGAATVGEGLQVPFTVTQVGWRLLDAAGNEVQRDAGRPGFAALAARLDAGLPASDEPRVLEASFRLRAGDGRLVAAAEGDKPLVMRAALTVEGFDVAEALLSGMAIDAPATVPAGAAFQPGVQSALLPNGLSQGPDLVRLPLPGGLHLPITLTRATWQVTDDRGAPADLPMLPEADEVRSVALTLEAEAPGLPPKTLRLGPVRIRFQGLDLKAALRSRLVLACPARVPPFAPLSARLDGDLLAQGGLPLAGGTLPVALASAEWSVADEAGAVVGSPLPSSSPTAPAFQVPWRPEDARVTVGARVLLRVGGRGLPVRDVELRLQATATVAGLDLRKAFSDALRVQAPAEVGPGQPLAARLESSLFAAADGVAGMLPIPDGPGVPFDVQDVVWTLRRKDPGAPIQREARAGPAARSVELRFPPAMDTADGLLLAEVKVDLPGRASVGLLLPAAPVRLGGLDRLATLLRDQLRVEAPATPLKAGAPIQAALAGAGLAATPDGLVGALGGDVPLGFLVEAAEWSLVQAGGPPLAPGATLRDPEGMRAFTFGPLVPPATVTAWVAVGLVVRLADVQAPPVRLELRSRPLRLLGMDLLAGAVAGRLRLEVAPPGAPGDWVEVRLAAGFPLQAAGAEAIGRPTVAGAPAELVVRTLASEVAEPGAALGGVARRKDALAWEFLFPPELAIRPNGLSHLRRLKVLAEVHLRLPDGGLLPVHRQELEAALQVQPILFPALAAVVDGGKLARVAVPDYYRAWHLDGWDSLKAILDDARRQVGRVLGELRARAGPKAPLEGYATAAEALRILLDATGGDAAFRFMAGSQEGFFDQPGGGAVPQVSADAVLVAFTNAWAAARFELKMTEERAQAVASAGGGAGATGEMSGDFQEMRKYFAQLKEDEGESTRLRKGWQVFDRFTRLPGAGPALVRRDLQDPDGAWSTPAAQHKALLGRPDPVTAVRVLPAHGHRVDWEVRAAGETATSTGSTGGPSPAGNPLLRLGREGWEVRSVLLLGVSPP